MICATWDCLPLVMVASDSTRELRALVLLFDRSFWPARCNWKSSVGTDVFVMSAPLASGSLHPLSGCNVTSTTPSNVSTCTAASVSCGSRTEWLTVSAASTAFPCTVTPVTVPTLTPATITSVPLVMPAASAKRAVTW